VSRLPPKRLAPENLPQHAALPPYDRTPKQIGIVHFGLGAPEL